MSEPIRSLDVVVPVYAAEDCLLPLYQRLRAALEPESVEWSLIMVDDASPDGSWQRIRELADRDARVHGYSLETNVGAPLAIACGLEQSRADAVVVMDCDLQDRPEEIPRLLEAAREGYDVVLARAVRRAEPWLRRFLSDAFRLVARLLGTPRIPLGTGSFRLMRRPVVDGVRASRERVRHLGFAMDAPGGRRTSVPVRRDRRYAGKSAWNPASLLAVAMDVLAAYATRPYRTAVGLGVAIALATPVWAVGRAATTGLTKEATAVAALVLLGGLSVALLGLLGLVLQQILVEVRGRPLYRVRTRTPAAEPRATGMGEASEPGERTGASSPQAGVDAEAQAGVDAEASRAAASTGSR